MSDFESLPIGTNALLNHLGYEHDGDVWRPVDDDQHLLRDTLAHHERRYVAEVAVVKPARELTYEDVEQPETWRCPDELRGLRVETMPEWQRIYRRTEAILIHKGHKVPA